MLDHPARIKAWLADLAKIRIALDAPTPPPVPQTPKRRRRRRPL